MSKAYPHFKPSYSHDELVEYFLLTPAELQFVLALRGDVNRCGAALLLKVLPYLGYVPEGFGQIPQEVRAFIAGQLGLLWDHSEGYPWYSSTRDHHLAQVRQFTGWRFPTAQDKVDFEQWLRQRAAYEAHSAEALLDSACQRLRQLRVELPTERELQRVINSALSGVISPNRRNFRQASFHDISGPDRIGSAMAGSPCLPSVSLRLATIASRSTGCLLPQRYRNGESGYAAMRPERLSWEAPEDCAGL